MVYSVVRIEEADNNDRAGAVEDRHWLELIRKMPDVRIDKVESARAALTRSAREEDKLIACVDLIYEDMELSDAIDNTRAIGSQTPRKRSHGC